MALLLAPYNDSMRLGMGFNSYTQTICIDNAVEVNPDNKEKVENPSQVVTYSSKFVERLSDVVSSMNISYSAAIKKGTIEVSGNGNSIDEDKIKASDINLVISVQVINQTTTLKDSAKFLQMDGVRAGSPEFNDAFGDCYISGFIEGGDFNSIISMRCLDRTKTNSIIRSIKKITKTKSEPQDFSMDSYGLSDSLAGSSALKETETTISVNWMGGGQIKDPKTSWDIDTVYEAAAAFPSFVAKTPQKTWAILTKYKANRSFNQWATSQSLKPLEYDAVISYTAELFNNFMEYKQLIKKVQDIIAHGDQYTEKLKSNGIPIHINTLVAVRSALRNEMNKIVAVVNLLSKKPEVLAQANSFDVISKNSLVRKIIEEAILASPESKIIYDDTVTSATATPSKPTQPSSDSSTGSDFLEVEHSGNSKTVATTAAGVKEPETPHGVKIDLSALIAPEVWADLLPIRTGAITTDLEDAGANAAAASLLPPPPKDDAVDFLSGNRSNKLKILAAVCGIHDVTQTLQDRVKGDAALSIPVNEIDKLAQGEVYKRIPGNFAKSLAFVYQFGDGPMRICAANFDKDSTATIEVTSTSEHTQVRPRSWNRETRSIVSLVYGGRIFNGDDQLKNLEDQIRRGYNDTEPSYHRVIIGNQLMGDDPWPNMNKTGIVFFKASETGPVRAAVALEGDECLVTDQPQLAQVSKEVVKAETKYFGFKLDTKDATFQITSTNPCTILLRPGGLNVRTSSFPFLVFPNGVSYYFLESGDFVIQDGQASNHILLAPLPDPPLDMRPSQLIALSGLIISRATAQRYEANIGFAIDSDSCGDGFYVGCSVNAGDCCSVGSSFAGKSVSFTLGSSSPNVIGKGFTGEDCLAANFVGQQASGTLNYFCLSKPSAPATSAHYLPNNGTSCGSSARLRRDTGRASVRSTKECRSPDHIIFPGGARASIEGLAEREYNEMPNPLIRFEDLSSPFGSYMRRLDMVVAHRDTADIDAQLAAFRK
ncbi:uncharacterized protein B0I36DRAFT_381409 [Microdochium trichocladiopsis]|uniref:MACPF domain-containing protein n=1 Tax=Microdochium trichocladiopsis TaxID=1682393 RepID=A0A9P8YCT3_9PEZI|nr:uncharacterized protein B0I36DRAFT_381409 [Microdochium trichocladiopsis]KAH7038401.1 hypothetical protein B0I36DRAFT_381409 [Microdochium trichocladiopsis]